MTEIDARTRRSQGGYAALWVLIILALFGALIGGTLLAEQGGGWILAGCLAVVLVGGVIEFRYDAYEACKVVGMIAWVVAGFSSLGVFLEDETPLGVWAVFLGGIAIGTACAAYRWRAARIEDPLENVLLENFDRNAIREIDGVQFAAWADSEEVVAGDRFHLMLMAQNCWDAERSLVVTVAQEQIGKGKAVIFQKESRLVLPGGAVSLLTIPVLTHPQKRGTLQMNVVPRVVGSGGTRVRKFQARRFEHKVSGTWTQFAALLAGWFVWGGGIVARVKIRKGDTAAPAPTAPLPPEVESIYEPDPIELKSLTLNR